MCDVGMQQERTKRKNFIARIEIGSVKKIEKTLGNLDTLQKILEAELDENLGYKS